MSWYDQPFDSYEVDIETLDQGVTSIEDEAPAQFLNPHHVKSLIFAVLPKVAATPRPELLVPKCSTKSSAAVFEVTNESSTPTLFLSRPHSSD